MDRQKIANMLEKSLLPLSIIAMSSPAIGQSIYPENIYESMNLANNIFDTSTSLIITAGFIVARISPKYNKPPESYDETNMEQ